MRPWFDGVKRVFLFTEAVIILEYITEQGKGSVFIAGTEWFFSGSTYVVLRIFPPLYKIVYGNILDFDFADSVVLYQCFKSTSVA